MPILAGLIFLKMDTNARNKKTTHCIFNKSKKSRMQCQTIHLTTIFILLFIILKVKSQKEGYTIENSINHSYCIQKNYKNAFYLTHLKAQKLKKSDRSNRQICLLLILLSNDIQPNPGPKPTNQNLNYPENVICSLCGYCINSNNLIKCNQCQNNYHLNCSNTPNINGSFEWVCPTNSCSNNYEVVELNIHINSPNRFENFTEDPTNDESVTKQTPNFYPQQTESMDEKENENKLLLLELPRISDQDYQGKDLCRGCFLPVKMNQQAISCDKCHMWIHRKCSDMSKKSYDKNRYLNYFCWICNVCREDEPENFEPFDPCLLSENERPQSLTEVKGEKNELLIINMNCRSSINKTEDLHYIFNELNPDIACHSETWFDESVPPQAYIPPGYKVIRKDRSEMFKQKYGKNSGGGIAIYYKEHLNVERKSNLTDEVEEILWVHVNTKRSFMLGTIYRANYTSTLDDSDGESKIEENIRKATEISDNLIVTGDYNVDMMNKNHKDTIKLKEIYDTYGLTQIISKPTRVNVTSKKPTTIDHIWTNLSHIVKAHGTFLGVSDHLGTYMRLNIAREKPQDKYIKIRCYANYTEELLNSTLSNNLAESNVQKYIMEKNINLATEELLKVTQQAINSIAPMKILKLKEKKKHIPWFTTELQNLIKAKNQFLEDYFCYGLSIFKDKTKEITNKIKHLKRKLKSLYFTEKISSCQNDAKKSWQVINQITQRTVSKETTEPDKMNQDKADNFNKYFATVGEEIQKNLKKEFQAESFEGLQGFDFQLETKASIDKIIDQIRGDVAIGHDEIGARIIKDGKPTLAPILTQLVNLSYELKTFPKCMKIAAIKALHKKEDKNDFSNYRPISILPTMSKVFERSATQQLAKYLENNNIISPSQHAYRKGHSTVTCLFEVVNQLYKLIDEKKVAAVISLDLSKAFDSINHNLMLNKLSKMGLSESSLLWIQSYLSDRQQFIRFKDYTSTIQPVKAGVPQGSIIGPLLFICYINDLYPTFGADSPVYSYADDTQIIVTAKNISSLIKKIEETIATAQKWYSDNSMKNNIGKSEILITTNKGPNHHIKIKIVEEGKRKYLKPKPFIKVLGVFLDENLNWNKHLKQVKKIATNSIRNLHRVNHLLPIKSRIYLYLTLVVPYFDYADIIYGGCSMKNSKYIQTSQNFAIRSITGTKKSESPKESFRKLKFLNLEKRRLVHEAVFAHKSLLSVNPERINLEYLQQLSTGQTRNTTHGTLNLPNHRCARYQKSPLFRTIKAWNSSPKDIPVHSLKSFKKHFQRNLIDKIYTH